MRIVFAGAHPYLPQIAGGIQSNTHELAQELIARGHQVSVLAGLTKAGWVGTQARLQLKFSRKRISRDRRLGYPVYRTWLAWEGAKQLVEDAEPDLVVAQSGQMVPVVDAFRRIGIPVVAYLHNIEFADHGGAFETLRDVPFIANSTFTAERYSERFSVNSTVINPLFQADRYRTPTTRERVLFVNPHPLKGVDIALELATACPQIPFDFVESWTLPEDQRRALKARVSLLPNVTLHPRTDELRKFYARAKIVLVPSQWEETWGRVASEAHFSGIPVLATRVGGLVEAVGPGGVLMDRQASVADWKRALSDIWTDEAAYAQLSQQALDYATRPQLDPGYQLTLLESVMEHAISKAASGDGCRLP